MNRTSFTACPPNNSNNHKSGLNVNVTPILFYIRVKFIHRSTRKAFCTALELQCFKILRAVIIKYFLSCVAPFFRAGNWYLSINSYIMIFSYAGLIDRVWQSTGLTVLAPSRVLEKCFENVSKCYILRIWTSNVIN